LLEDSIICFKRLIQSTEERVHDRAAWADETRSRILDAAERLFAERGFEAVSLRQITRDADVNIAAIHYHYGSREGLLRAVLDRVIVPLNQMRLEMLDRALDTRRGKPLPVGVVLDAFIRPDLVAINDLRNGRGVTVARLVGRTYSTASPPIRKIGAEQFALVWRRFNTELARSMPGLPPEEIQWRLGCVVGVIVSLFVHATPPGVPGRFDTDDIDGTLARIISFVEPGLSAPAPGTQPRKTRSQE
jgi:AcrR family transcriptional regulator